MFYVKNGNIVNEQLGYMSDKPIAIIMSDIGLLKIGDRNKDGDILQTYLIHLNNMINEDTFNCFKGVKAELVIFDDSSLTLEEIATLFNYGLYHTPGEHFYKLVHSDVKDVKKFLHDFNYKSF